MFNKMSNIIWYTLYKVRGVEIPEGNSTTLWISNEIGGTSHLRSRNKGEP